LAALRQRGLQRMGAILLQNSAIHAGVILHHPARRGNLRGPICSAGICSTMDIDLESTLIIRKDNVMKATTLFSAIILLGLLGGPPARAAKPGGSFQLRPNVSKKEVVYKTVDDLQLKLHVFEPKQRSPRRQLPAIVFFFGGGWNGGTPAQFFPQCDYLASRGMVAVSAEYRTKGNGGVTPFECVNDGKSAIRYVRSHAAELGIDPNKLAAGGGSAGGHVAAATGTLKGLEPPGEDTSVSSRPDAMVLFNPVYDNGPGGYGYSRVKDRYKEISPFHNIGPHVPPAIVFFGTEEKLVSRDAAEQFKEKMEKLEIRSDLHYYEGQSHGFFNYGRGNNVYFIKTMREADKFLGSLGYLEGEPEM